MTRIAVGGFLHETNTFAPTKAVYDDFVHGGGWPILVNKSSVHFRADFEPIAEKLIICAAPGAMPADTASLPWKRLRPGIRIKPNGPSFTPVNKSRPPSLAIG